MSRIGKKPIIVPSQVTVTVEGQNITVKGAKGELKCTIRSEIKVVYEGNILSFKEKKTSKDSSALWGMSRALVANMIKGVSEGYEKKLELIGVGYRVKESSEGISLSVGYSHPIDYQKPEGITFTVEDNKIIAVKGVDKQLVGQVAAEIRSIRKPEVYKGKGIRYQGELIKLKPGKAGKI